MRPPIPADRDVKNNRFGGQKRPSPSPRGQAWPLDRTASHFLTGLHVESGLDRRADGALFVLLLILEFDLREVHRNLVSRDDVTVPASTSLVGRDKQVAHRNGQECLLLTSGLTARENGRLDLLALGTGHLQLRPRLVHLLS